ncbi:hypothetical protein BDB01DRAFT_781150 [Pilobolus umbonatus]|nr:hypothetical protein BDB01DRAFT_781150 [Pilobolus umbonatus]
MTYQIQSFSCGSAYEPSEVDPEDQTWDDWSQDEEEQDSKCLFCDKHYNKIEDTFKHIKLEHGFDFQGTRRSLQLDFYDCIRLINYIRHQVKSTPALSSVKAYKLDDTTAWKDDKYLQPVMEDDTLLFAFEELDDCNEEDESDMKPVSELDLSIIKPSTELEKKLLEMLANSQEYIINLEGQFEEYKCMVKKKFYSESIMNSLDEQ